MRILRVYNKVFRIEKTVYSIQGMSLPFPVSYRQMAFFVGTLGLMILLNILPGTRWIFQNVPILNAYLVRFVGIPAFSAWFFTQKTLDGKAPHRFLWRYLEFWISPHWFRRYEEVEQPRDGKWQYEGVVAYRNYGER